MALMFWIGSRWREPAAPEQPPTAPQAGNPSAARPSRSMWIAAIVAVFAALMWRPVAGEMLDATQPVGVGPPLQAALGAFAEASALPFEPTYTGAREAVRSSRTIDGGSVELQAFYYARQHESHEMIHAGNALVRSDDPRWPVLSRGAQSTPFGTVQAYRIGYGAGASLLVWHWYAVDGTQTASAYRAKAATTWSLVTGRGDHSLAVALATTVGDGSAEALRAAEQRLVKAAAAITPVVDAGSRGRAGPGQRR